MAFVKKNFTPIGGQSSRGHGPQMFAYNAGADALATVKASAHFNDMAGLLVIGDMIHVFASDGMGILQVKTAVKPITVDLAKSVSFLPMQTAGPMVAGVIAVVLPTAEPDANYMVVVEGPLLADSYAITDKTAAGFTIRSSDATSTTSVLWKLLR